MSQAPQKSAPPQKRALTFSVSVPAFICGLLVLLAAFVWVFILGVILGRGHKPEDAIPELARIMPQGETGAVEDARPRIIGGQTTPQETPAPPDGMMTQEDLNFHNNVRGGKSTQPKPAPAAPAKKPDAPAKPETAKKPEPAAKPEAAKKPETAKKPEAAKPEAAKPEAAKKPETTAQTSDDNAVYAYVYQVAAYKEAAPAEAFAAKLKAAGLQARTQKQVENNVTWHRIMVDFKGTPEDTRTLRAKLEQQGISKVILRSKTK